MKTSRQAWAAMISGVLLGFSLLFLTVFDASVPDARSIAAILAAMGGVAATGATLGRKRCTGGKAGD